MSIVSKRISLRHQRKNKYLPGEHSMTNEREMLLTGRDYEIAGNELRAFFDVSGRLVFVIDYEVNDKKSNALLVINSDGDRKWDDILKNTYGVDLETVRPKKDNKYQKLDIEYSGLNVYADLLSAYDAGSAFDNELLVLNQFRDIVVRRAAAERLVTAETLADNARETIERAKDSIEEQNERVRELRVRLAQARKDIGKEPTKQSAAKILRLESQIDATNEKIRRAKKRLNSAQKRLVLASDDADAARDILERVGFETDNVNDDAIDLPMTVVEQPVANFVTPPLPAEIKQNNLTTVETKAEEMADEEVKPLFDTDPEILDEEIAFKPIDFSSPSVTPVSQIQPLQTESPVDEYADTSAIEPLSFVPPVSTVDQDVVVEEKFEPSVLDSITAVESPVVGYPDEEKIETVQKVVAPVYQSETTPAPAPMPVDEVVPAPVDSGFRPVSPITGVAPAAVPSEGEKTRNKPSFSYYVLLLLLIGLSIFTLWFYQKSTGNNALPSLSGSVSPELVVDDAEKDILSEEQPPVVAEENKPVVDVIEVVEDIQPTVTESVVEPEPESVPVVQPAPEPKPEVEPVVIEAPVVEVVPTDVPVPVMDVKVRTVPALPEPEPVVIETEEEILAKKPAYGVSQNEAMFVADEEFETDRETVLEIEEDATVVDFDDTPIVETSEPEYEYEYSDDYVVEEVPMCEGGASTDRFGCCPGETYTQIDNGGFVCCPDAGGDCFPPLK